MSPQLEGQSVLVGQDLLCWGQEAGRTAMMSLSKDPRQLRQLRLKVPSALLGQLEGTSARAIGTFTGRGQVKPLGRVVPEEGATYASCRAEKRKLVRGRKLAGARYERHAMSESLGCAREVPAAVATATAPATTCDQPCDWEAWSTARRGGWARAVNNTGVLYILFVYV